VGNIVSYDMQMKVLKGGIELTLKDKLNECGLGHPGLMAKASVQTSLVRRTFGHVVRTQVNYTFDDCFRYEKKVEGDLQTAITNGLLKDMTREIVAAVLPYFLMTAVQLEKVNGQHT
jgi:hypothetical protein